MVSCGILCLISDILWYLVSYLWCLMVSSCFLFVVFCGFLFPICGVLWFLLVSYLWCLVVSYGIFCHFNVISIFFPCQFVVSLLWLILLCFKNSALKMCNFSSF